MSTHRNRTVMAEINMVPFIDITLILLIIFMVMSPLLVQMQLTVDLPKSQAINTQAEDDVIRIEVEKNGTITVQNKHLTLKNLERELILRMGKANKKTILVQADKDVPIQQVVNVFDVAKKLGAAKLGIGVLSKSE
ncbi:ExbD/TolR family protein [Candidatus Avelusimicrobium luingense]|uniref:ExbD/TolR family protein n=1 Tax=Candidatus Avelusimicrobium luingense TaxID=3416211 RepID=UPI003D12BA09